MNHEALLYKLRRWEITFETNVQLKVNKGKTLNKVYYADVTCYDKIIVELKTIDGLLPELKLR